MKFLGIDIEIKNTPALDPGFLPMSLFCREFLKQAKKPIAICIERNDHLCAVYDTFITGTNREADQYYVEHGEEPAVGQGRVPRDDLRGRRAGGVYQRGLQPNRRARLRQRFYVKSI